MRWRRRLTCTSKLSTGVSENDQVAQPAGEESAQRLFIGNSHAAMDGTPMPRQPESEDFWEGVPLKFDRGVLRMRPGDDRSRPRLSRTVFQLPQRAKAI